MPKEIHDIERFLATARKVMGRRDKELSAAEEKVLRDVYAATAKMRAEHHKK